MPSETRIGIDVFAPKGLRPLAQGYRAAATLGGDGRLDPSQGSRRRRQPWAVGCSPFGAKTVKVVSLALCLMLSTGCRQEMAQQPKYLPLESSSFFPDGRSARPLVPGVVVRGQLRNDWHFFFGQHKPAQQRVRMASLVGVATQGPLVVGALSAAQSPYVDTFPEPITKQMLERGQQRFQIFCAVCHDAAGYGNGIVVQRGFTKPPSYHEERLRAAPVGYFYDVITHGYGSMPSYKEQIPPRDRWAIVAYLRALQLSQNAPLADLPAEKRKAIERSLEKPLEPGR
jgi:mono/diheme cytochrome c family protein